MGILQVEPDLYAIAVESAGPVGFLVQTIYNSTNTTKAGSQEHDVFTYSDSIVFIYSIIAQHNYRRVCRFGVSLDLSCS